MEIDDELASRIHGIISSDSDSDSDNNREFDEEYNLLKPPPYDYELIKDKIVIISSQNKPVQDQVICIADHEIKKIDPIYDATFTSRNATVTNKNVWIHFQRNEKSKADRNSKALRTQTSSGILKSVHTILPPNRKKQKSKEKYADFNEALYDLDLGEAYYPFNTLKEIEDRLYELLNNEHPKLNKIQRLLDLIQREFNVIHMRDNKVLSSRKKSVEKISQNIEKSRKLGRKIRNFTRFETKKYLGMKIKTREELEEEFPSLDEVYKKNFTGNWKTNKVPPTIKENVLRKEKKKFKPLRISNSYSVNMPKVGYVEKAQKITTNRHNFDVMKNTVPPASKKSKAKKGKKKNKSKETVKKSRNKNKQEETVNTIKYINKNIMEKNNENKIQIYGDFKENFTEQLDEIDMQFLADINAKIKSSTNLPINIEEIREEINVNFDDIEPWDMEPEQNNNTGAIKKTKKSIITSSNRSRNVKENLKGIMKERNEDYLDYMEIITTRHMQKASKIWVKPSPAQLHEEIVGSNWFLPDNIDNKIQPIMNSKAERENVCVIIKEEADTPAGTGKRMDTFEQSDLELQRINSLKIINNTVKVEERLEENLPNISEKQMYINANMANNDMKYVDPNAVFYFDEGFRHFLHTIVWEGTNPADLSLFSYEQLYGTYMAYTRKSENVNTSKKVETKSSQKKKSKERKKMKLSTAQLPSDNSVYKFPQDIQSNVENTSENSSVTVYKNTMSGTEENPVVNQFKNYMEDDLRSNNRSPYSSSLLFNQLYKTYISYLVQTAENIETMHYYSTFTSENINSFLGMNSLTYISKTGFNNK